MIEPLTKEQQLGKGSKKKKSAYVLLKDKAWKLCSEYIRLRDADMYGYCSCISCGKREPWKGGKIHAGHFIPRNKGTYFYFLEENIHSQCYMCNCRGSNHTGAMYAKNLADKIGKDRVDILLKKSEERFLIKKFEECELEEVIKYFKKEIETLKKIKGL